MVVFRWDFLFGWFLLLWFLLVFVLCILLVFVGFVPAFHSDLLLMWGRFLAPGVLPLEVLLNILFPRRMLGECERGLGLTGYILLLQILIVGLALRLGFVFNLVVALKFMLVLLDFLLVFVFELFSGLFFVQVSEVVVVLLRPDEVVLETIGTLDVGMQNVVHDVDVVVLHVLQVLLHVIGLH